MKKKSQCIKFEIGTNVIMNDKYYVSDKNKSIIFRVASEPFDLCGTICVMLDGYRGGYAMDGLSKVESEE